jgi:leucyl-tRNA synthetase
MKPCRNRMADPPCFSIACMHGGHAVTYPFKSIEARWQQTWQDRGDYHTHFHGPKPKQFLLAHDYQSSGSGLPLGHLKDWLAMDALARKRRMEGFEVFFSIGIDPSALVAEGTPCKVGMPPGAGSLQGHAHGPQLLRALGISSDWRSQTPPPEADHGKWNQWLFLQAFKRGLIYKAPVSMRWCPACKTSQADKEDSCSVCERCGTWVVRHRRQQWLLRIDRYADRLLDDLDSVDCSSRVAEQQRKWIGPAAGADILFPVAGVNRQMY